MTGPVVWPQLEASDTGSRWPGRPNAAGTCWAGGGVGSLSGRPFPRGAPRLRGSSCPREPTWGPSPRFVSLPVSPTSRLPACQPGLSGVGCGGVRWAAGGVAAGVGECALSVARRAPLLALRRLHSGAEADRGLLHFVVVFFPPSFKIKICLGARVSAPRRLSC